jgi:hypothetical protein
VGTLLGARPGIGRRDPSRANVGGLQGNVSFLLPGRWYRIDASAWIELRATSRNTR